MSGMLFGSSGIRQKYSHNLVYLAQRTGLAVGAGSGSVLVGRDTRNTSGILESALMSGILGSGCSVQSCGIVPTPTVAYGARNIAKGVMITASHNPDEYNGIKLFNPDGSLLTPDEQETIEQRVAAPCWSGWECQGDCTRVDAATPHEDAILRARSIGRETRVILDCGGGAGASLTPRLLKELGIRTTCINCTPQSPFPRPSEPVPENLPYLPEMVRKCGAACAIAHDGDADRMVAFDGRGTFICGDQMLMLFARYLGAKRVVTTFDASMALEEVAEVRRTPVGDTYVSGALRSWGDFGGEPSGAWIFPQISLCPDGPYAAALFCEIASEWNIMEVIASMPRYPILRESFACEDAKRIVTTLGAANPTDGFRHETEEGWFLVRASGTEPKIRITSEGKTPDRAKALMDQGKTMVSRVRKTAGAT